MNKNIVYWIVLVLGLVLGSSAVLAVDSFNVEGGDIKIINSQKTLDTKDLSEDGQILTKVFNIKNKLTGKNLTYNLITNPTNPGDVQITFNGGNTGTIAPNSQKSIEVSFEALVDNGNYLGNIEVVDTNVDNTFSQNVLVVNTNGGGIGNGDEPTPSPIEYDLEINTTTDSNVNQYLKYTNNKGYDIIGATIADVTLTRQGGNEKLTMDFDNSPFNVLNGQSANIEYSIATKNNNLIGGAYIGKIVVKEKNNEGSDTFKVRLNLKNKYQKGLSFKNNVGDNNVDFMIVGNIDNNINSQISYKNKKGYNLDLLFEDIVLTKNDGSGQTITVNLADDVINDLPNGNTQTINYNIQTIGEEKGIYKGNVEVEDEIEGISEIYSLELRLIDQDDINISIVGSSQFKEINNESGFVVDTRANSRKKFSFNILNNGNIDIKGLNVALEGDLISDTGKEISEDDIDFDFSGSTITKGKAKRVVVEVDVPKKDISLEEYRGVLKIDADNEFSREYFFIVNVTSGDQSIEIVDYSGNVYDGIIQTGQIEQGDTKKNIRFRVENNGDVVINNIQFRFTGNFTSDNGNTMSSNVVNFQQDSIFALEPSDDEDVRFNVRIPNNQKAGIYTAEMELYNDNDDSLTTIDVEIPVIGEVYVKSVNFEEEVLASDLFDIDVLVRNKGNKVQRDVSVRVELEDADEDGDSISKRSNKFTLNARKERTERFSFDLPDDISEGSHSIKITVFYGDEEVERYETFNVVREKNNLKIEESGVSSTKIDCGKKLYSYLKVKNIGSNNKEIRLSAEVLDTDVYTISESFRLDVGEDAVRNFVLSTENLKEGNYILRQKVIYDGVFKQKETAFTIKCSGGEIIVNPTEPTKPTRPDNNEGNYDLFGYSVEPLTLYLIFGVLILFILIGTVFVVKRR